MGAEWQDVMREFDRWGREARPVRIWLRDDDAISATPALDMLMALTARHDVPVLLGVIPMQARPSLAQHLEQSPAVTVAMHGVWHRDQAAVGQKKQELPPELGREVIMDTLRAGRSRLLELFGPAAGTWYIPPWNLISPMVAALLPEAGFSALSCFATAAHTIAGLAQHNTHVDLMDWHGGRTGKSGPRIAAELAMALASARADDFRPVGVLAHHLVHDANAWKALSDLLAATRSHPAVQWLDSGTLPGSFVSEGG